jgi:hypothetical protein
MTFEEKLAEIKRLTRELLAELRKTERGGGDVILVCVDRETGEPLVDDEWGEIWAATAESNLDPGEGAWRAYLPLDKEWEG